MQPTHSVVKSPLSICSPQVVGSLKPVKLWGIFVCNQFKVIFVHQQAVLNLVWVHSPLLALELIPSIQSTAHAMQLAQAVLVRESPLSQALLLLSAVNNNLSFPKS